MTEWEFPSQVVELADRGILLDVKNIHVSSQKHNSISTTSADARNQFEGTAGAARNS